MFEVGRSYRVTTLEGDEAGYITSTVLEVDLPLVKFSRPGNYIIINMASSSFISAEPNDQQAKDAEAADLKRSNESFSANYGSAEEDEGDRYKELDEDHPKGGY